MNIIKKFWVKIVLTISIIVISIALIAEYFFEVIPCQMCIYQRYSYYLIIIFTLIYLISKKISLVIYYWVINLLFAIGIFFATWHVGIEQKILPGLTGCSNALNKSETLEDLKDQITNQSIVSCDEIIWSFMGISMATWNLLLLVLLFTLGITLTLQKSFK